MKKAKIFGRSIPVLAIVAIVASAGMVSAALLSYYGKITTTAKVKQSVVVDGGNYLQINTYGSNTVAGNTVRDGPHTLLNRADVPVTVTLETTQSGDGTPDGNVDGIATSYHKSVEYSYSQVLSGLGVTVEDTGDGWLKWTYTYADDPTHTPKMTVAINYEKPDSFGITTFDDGSHDGWYYCTATEETRIGDYGLATYEDWAEAGSIGNNQLYVKILKTRLPNTFMWHGYANYNGQPVWIEIDTGQDPYGPALAKATIREPLTGTVTLQPGEMLDFYIVNKFDVALIPGTYTITTTVVPE